MLATVDESITRVMSSLAARFPPAQQQVQAIQPPIQQSEALQSRLRKPAKITGFPVRRPREIRERQVRKNNIFSHLILIHLFMISV